jgi:hypothetical protein
MNPLDFLLRNPSGRDAGSIARQRLNARAAVPKSGGGVYPERLEDSLPILSLPHTQFQVTANKNLVTPLELLKVRVAP